MERTFLLIVGILALLAALIFFSARHKWHPSMQLGATPVVKEQDADVWINTRSGFYYCRDSNAYGKLQPGKYLREREAVQQGYRPFFERPCSL